MEVGELGEGFWGGLFCQVQLFQRGKDACVFALVEVSLFLQLLDLPLFSVGLFAGFVSIRLVLG